MATILFMVKATIPSDKEAAFNRWYNEEHVPQVFQFPGSSARTATSSWTATINIAIWRYTSYRTRRPTGASSPPTT